MDKPKDFLDKILLPGVEHYDAEMPEEYLPPEHPLQRLAEACVKAMEEYQYSLRPEVNLRWSHCTQELGDCWPGIVTMCYFEMDWATDDERMGALYWLQQRIEQLLPDVRNLHVKLSGVGN